MKGRECEGRTVKRSKGNNHKGISTFEMEILENNLSISRLR